MPKERLPKFCDARIGGHSRAEELLGCRGALRLKRAPVAAEGVLVRGRRLGDRESEPPILSVPDQSDTLVPTAVLCVGAPERVRIVRFGGEMLASRIQDVLDHRPGLDEDRI